MNLTDFGMYTSAGNEAVRKIVERAVKNGTSFEKVMQELADIACTNPALQEATDIVVRERVYAVMSSKI